MPSGKNAWLTFLTFDLLMILAILLAVSMPNILLVHVEGVKMATYSHMHIAAPYRMKHHTRESSGKISVAWFVRLLVGKA